MDKITDTLQADYEAFIHQPIAMAFFSSLADYAGFMLQTSTTKDIVGGVMKSKQDMLDELERLESQSLQEMEVAKEKLLKVIKDNNVDPAKFAIRYAAAPGVSHEHLPAYNGA